MELKLFATMRVLIIFLSVSFIISCATTDLYKDLTAQQIYKSGMDNMQRKRYHMAIKDFEALEANYPYGDYTEKSQLALIDAYYEKGESSQATAAANRFIRLFPNNKQIDKVYYTKGLINYDENYTMVYKYFPIDRAKRDTEQALNSFNDFKALIEKFPKSKYVPEARARMVHLKNQLARHDLYIAQYYFDKKAYIAAANNAEQIVYKYNKSDSTKKALEIMQKSYTHMGMPELAKKAEITLKETFS